MGSLDFFEQGMVGSRFEEGSISDEWWYLLRQLWRVRKVLARIWFCIICFRYGNLFSSTQRSNSSGVAPSRPRTKTFVPIYVFVTSLFDLCGNEQSAWIARTIYPIICSLMA